MEIIGVRFGNRRKWNEKVPKPKKELVEKVTRPRICKGPITSQCRNCKKTFESFLNRRSCSVACSRTLVGKHGRSRGVFNFRGILHQKRPCLDCKKMTVRSIYGYCCYCMGKRKNGPSKSVKYRTHVTRPDTLSEVKRVYKKLDG